MIFTSAWWAAHKKALAAFLTLVIAQAGALGALGILSGPVSHNIAVAIEALSPILVFLGVKVGPANVPK